MERASQELTIAGARPRRHALNGRDALTPSELRVSQLAAQSLTDAAKSPRRSSYIAHRGDPLDE